MSIQAVAWALEQEIKVAQKSARADKAREVADPWAKLILISLANHADHTTGLCWPPMKLIGKEASCRRETVLRKLPILESVGLIEIIRANKGDRRRVHTYRLLIPGCAPDAHQIAATRRDARSIQMCAPITRGCEPAVTTKNHHKTITFPKPLSGTREGPRAFQGKKQEGLETIQNRIALRLGGWEILQQLSPSTLDRITAMERIGTLDDAALARVVAEHRMSGLQP
jgi:hypothetical protein